MKRKHIAALTILFFIVAGYKFYTYIMPRVEVENLSRQSLQTVTVTLPNNTLKFSNISAGSIHVANHSPQQHDGVYKYKVHFSSGAILSGECGHITANEFGEMFLLTIRSENAVTCDNQASPIFNRT